MEFRAQLINILNRTSNSRIESIIIVYLSHIPIINISFYMARIVKCTLCQYIMETPYNGFDMYSMIVNILYCMHGRFKFNNYTK